MRKAVRAALSACIRPRPYTGAARKAVRAALIRGAAVIKGGHAPAQELESLSENRFQRKPLSGKAIFERFFAERFSLCHRLHA